MALPAGRQLAAASAAGRQLAAASAAGRQLAAASAAGRQLSFDDLSPPLRDVTFCVVDLETTGGQLEGNAITEVGAVKVRGGEVLGTFQTLVNPGRAIPPEITVLTGITEAMVVRAPTADQVLPSFLEFLGDGVIVGHNVRFDVGFLDAALRRSGRPPLDHTIVDTLGLSRRLLRSEVPNLRLSTLASRLRLPHRPSHRALDDAWATTDLLHLLLERAGSVGACWLDDLLALPSVDSHPQAAKLKLTVALPRSPGVYLFRDRTGRVLYVGKATNLRARVRSYFSTDDRRKVTRLLAELASLDHVVTPHLLAAEVAELRLIHQHQPTYNRRGKGTGRPIWLKLTLAERWPRLSVVTTRRDDGNLYLGPVPSRRTARLAVEAVEQATMVRRCRRPSTRTLVPSPCSSYQLGCSACPCSGATSDAQYGAVVEHVRRGLTTEPRLLTEPLQLRLRRLAGEQRFEEAADVRDRAAALVQVLQRERRLALLRAAGTVRVRLQDGQVVELHEGRLHTGELPLDTGRECGLAGPAGHAEQLLADELLCATSWLLRNASSVRLEEVTGVLASPLPALPSFTARPGARSAPASRAA
jgi:DNA polymerase-3 subunit epsilon